MQVEQAHFKEKKNMNKLISLTEFAEISQIPLDKILLLIEQKLIPLSIVEGKPVMIDMAKFDLDKCLEIDLEDIKSLKTREQNNLELSDREIEIFSAKMLASLEEITREAFELAEKWNSN